MHTAADGSYGLFFIICDGEMIVGTIYACVHPFFVLLSFCPFQSLRMAWSAACPRQKGLKAMTKNISLNDLINSLGTITMQEKAPTAKCLRETAGEPVAASDDCVVYANGYLLMIGKGRPFTHLRKRSYPRVSVSFYGALGSRMRFQQRYLHSVQIGAFQAGNVEEFLQERHSTM